LGEFRDVQKKQETPTWLRKRWIDAGLKLRRELLGVRMGYPRENVHFWAEFFAFFARQGIFTYLEIFDEARELRRDNGLDNTDMQPFHDALDRDTRFTLNDRLVTRAKAEGRWLGNLRERRAVRLGAEEAAVKRSEGWFKEAIWQGVCPECGNLEGGSRNQAPDCHGWGSVHLDRLFKLVKDGDGVDGGSTQGAAQSLTAHPGRPDR
jgi:hypothetical protein